MEINQMQRLHNSTKSYAVGAAIGQEAVDLHIEFYTSLYTLYLMLTYCYHE